MGMRRRGPRQDSLWVSHSDIAEAPGHRFYTRLDALLTKGSFDRQVEELCAPYYEPEGTPGRPSTPPSIYFRMLLIGYFEGIESERGICWRCADSLSLREFLGLSLTDDVANHSTLSRIRSRLPAHVYSDVFRLVLEMVNRAGLLKGKVAGIDATYLRADASMKSIVRRDTKEGYAAYLTRLAKESGMAEPTAEDGRRLDRKRRKKTSNREWASPTDPDARIGRLKDGRTRLAYKAENVVDMDTSAIVAAEIHPADEADTATLPSTLDLAEDNVEAARASSREDSDDEPDPPGTGSDSEPDGFTEIVADKGYHKADLIRRLRDTGYRTYIPEPCIYGKRHWADKGGLETARAIYQNRARTQRRKSRRLQRRRGELLERPFAHLCETGAFRRVRLRGRVNVAKRYVIQAAAWNLGLILRNQIGWGTPRGLAEGLRRRMSAPQRLPLVSVLSRARIKSFIGYAMSIQPSGERGLPAVVIAA